MVLGRKNDKNGLLLNFVPSSSVHVQRSLSHLSFSLTVSLCLCLRAGARAGVGGMCVNVCVCVGGGLCDASMYAFVRVHLVCACMHAGTHMIKSVAG